MTSQPIGATPAEPSPTSGELGSEEPTDAQPRWRSVHRITPLLNAWKVAVALVAILVVRTFEDLRDLPFNVWVIVGIGVAVVLVAILISLVYSYLAWKRLRFAITNESVIVRRGLIFRSERVARLTRIQSVEITQPLLGRIFGFSALEIESAGGEESTITLQYLSHKQARSVRNEILARAAGIAFDSPTLAAGSELGSRVSHEEPQAPEAPETLLYDLGASRLLVSILLHANTVVILILLVGLVIATVVSGGLEFLWGWLFAILGLVSAIWGRFAQSFGFRLSVSPDGLRARSGLLETKARTIPPGRIQCFWIRQPLLWRPLGWWRVRVGLARMSGEEGAGEALIPVATLDELRALLPLAHPELTPDDEAPLVAGLVGTGGAAGWEVSPRRARWVDPFAYRRNGFRVLPSVLAVRTGRWWRELKLLPHARTQSLGISDGPLDRKLRLTTFEAHIAGIGISSPSLPHLDPDVAARLVREQAGRARLARREAGPEHWMEQPLTASSQPEPSSPSAPPPRMES